MSAQDLDAADAAQAAAVRAMLSPASIAIIGASDKSRWSINVVENLREGGYAGRVHLVNPRGAIAHGQPCATRCAAVGGRIDLGLVLAPGPGGAGALADL
ncbi:MAG: CoA-binding protein, partial [Rhizobacter sp.]|nr:CoA-binding protein [Rhizobacter sp.]